MLFRGWRIRNAKSKFASRSFGTTVGFPGSPLVGYGYGGDFVGAELASGEGREVVSVPTPRL